jgi:tetratricopeptide (TPR) repeat protein
MVMGQAHRHPRALDFADAHHLLGNLDSARVYYEVALPTLERIRREDPEWPGPDLARAYAGLGQVDAAVREAELILSLIPYDFDAVLNPHLRFDLAESYVMVGEVDRALDQMALALAVPTTWGSPIRFRLSPFFRSLRGHPRFEALLQEQESVRF